MTTNMDIQIRPVKKIRIVGSCNWLVLLTTICTGDLILWNPSTRKTKCIKNFAPFIRGVGYGFGYDQLSEDYEVVIIKDGQHSQQHKTLTGTRMYSLKTDSWKEIENLKKRFFQYDGKFVDGKLHWLVGELGCGWDIVALDLVEEKYVIMARPECFSGLYGGTAELVNLGGYLSLMNCSGWLGASEWELWVMIEYGAMESWTKIWTFTDICDRPVGDRRARPLYFKRNGDIVVAFGSNVVVYNGEKLLRRFRVDKFDRLIGSIAYVESLVSPFGVESLDSPLIVNEQLGIETGKKGDDSCSINHGFVLRMKKRKTTVTVYFAT